MMNFSFSVPLLSLFLLLMFGIGGCAELLLGKSYHGFHGELQGKIITDTTAKLERNPYDAELYVVRGKAYSCITQYEKALSDFNRAIEIDPENAAAYRGRGSVAPVVDNKIIGNEHSPENNLKSIRVFKKKEADINKANILNPGKLDEEVNQGFGYISKTTNEFIYPVAGDCVAENDLILGSTTKTQVAEMIPPIWGTIGTNIYPIYKPTKPRIGKVGKVVKNARYKFKPLHPWIMSLIFDKNDKLTVIQYVETLYYKDIELDERFPNRNQFNKINRLRLEKFQDLMRQYQFAEAYRESATKGRHATKTLRAEITPCVTIDIEVPIEPSLDMVSYIIDYIYINLHILVSSVVILLHFCCYFDMLTCRAMSHDKKRKLLPISAHFYPFSQLKERK